MSRPPDVTSEVLVRGLFEEHGAALMAYAARLTGDHGQAADAVRDALLAAVRQPGALGGGRGAVRAYLFSLLRGADGIAALAAVESLPREERAVLHALYFQGLGLAETAASLEVPAETVQIRAHQALRRLRGAGAVSGHRPDQLGAYVLGVLDGAEWAGVREHLETCAPCRQEVAELREAEAALGGIPPEAFVEGPPPGGDPVLRRTLDAVRDEHRHRTRRRRAVLAAASVVGIAAAFGAGVVVGRLADPGAPSARPPSAVAGARTATATDTRTGVTMTVAIDAAAGWVRVRATIGGVAAGEQCRLYVVARDGSRWQAASWLAPALAPDDTTPDDAPDGANPDDAPYGTTLDGSALIAPADVALVQAETVAGLVLVSTPV